MNKTTKVITVVAAGALVATLGLTACGGNSASSSAPASNSNTSASASNTAANANASASSNANANTASSSASSASSDSLESIVETAFMGSTDDGKYLVFYYDLSDANDPVAESFGMLAFANANGETSDDVKLYSGLITLDADGKTCTLADSENGAIKFSVDGINTDGTLNMTFGTYGTAKVTIVDTEAVAQEISSLMSDSGTSNASVNANSNTSTSSSESATASR